MKSLHNESSVQAVAAHCAMSPAKVCPFDRASTTENRRRPVLPLAVFSSSRVPMLHESRSAVANPSRRSLSPVATSPSCTARQRAHRAHPSFSVLQLVVVEL
jgi:hypothetical protein